MADCEKYEKHKDLYLVSRFLCPFWATVKHDSMVMKTQRFSVWDDYTSDENMVMNIIVHSFL